jgi:gliding motility-associated-like protein
VPGTMIFSSRVDFPTGTNTEQLAIGDLNGDGKPDLVVSNLRSSNVSVFENTTSNGTISFGAKQDYFVAGPIGVAIGDLSGDGKPELAVASFSTNKIVVFPNHSSGANISFGAKLEYDCGNSPVEVSIGDIDGDGNPDIALTNASINFISVMKMDPGIPTLNLGEDIKLCQGDSAILSANVLNATYQWSTGAKTSSITVKQSGSYWLKASTGGVTIADTINVTFTPPPVFNLGSDTTVCAGEKLLLQPAVSNASYLWQDGSTEGSMTVSQPGTFWLTLKKDGCTASDTINVNYKPLPHVTLGSDTAFCTGSTLELIAKGTSIESYFWQNGTTQPSVTVRVPGTYWVRVRGGNGCSASDTIRVAEHAAFTLGKDTTLCEGATLDYRFLPDNTSFLWNDGSTQNHFSINSAGLYWMEASQAGCIHRDSITVSYQPLPVVNLGTDTLLCEGVSKVLNAYNTNATYLWNNGSTASSVTARQPGTYWATVSLNGCVERDTIQISYRKLPTLSLGQDTVLCHGQSITLEPTVNGVAFLWQDGSTAARYTITKPGTYHLAVSNDCGIASDEIVITEGLCTIAMPNAFTPNRDGKNDLFRVKHPSFIKEFRMQVYNRWGQVVFHTTDPYKGWDGTANGSPAPEGNYVWTIKLTDKSSVKQFFRGNVMLIR